MKESTIVLTIGLPVQTNGSGLALRSSLRLYQEKFDLILWLYCVDDGDIDEVEVDFPQVVFKKLPTSVESLSKRFSKTLFSLLPACTTQYCRRDLVKAFEGIVGDFWQNSRSRRIILEHVAPARVFYESKFFRDSTVVCAFRAHDVLSSAFKLLASSCRFPLRFAWRFEAWRVRLFEKQIISRADIFWTITEEDFCEFENLYSVEPDGVISVGLDTLRYHFIGTDKDPLLFCSIGGIDARKSLGYARFFDRVWYPLKKKYPKIKFVCAGSGSEAFDDQELGIVGIGIVSDERELLSRATFFVNPQVSGSGIKLKSLVSMASKCCLISFSNGVRGIGGQNRKHFAASDSDAELISLVSELIDNTLWTKAMMEDSREFIERKFSQDKLKRLSMPYIDRFLRMNGKKPEP